MVFHYPDSVNLPVVSPHVPGQRQADQAGDRAHRDARSARCSTQAAASSAPMRAEELKALAEAMQIPVVTTLHR